jgi:hypothetical protein
MPDVGIRLLVEAENRATQELARIPQDFERMGRGAEGVTRTFSQTGRQVRLLAGELSSELNPGARQHRGPCHPGGWGDGRHGHRDGRGDRRGCGCRRSCGRAASTAVALNKKGPASPLELAGGALGGRRHFSPPLCFSTQSRRYRRVRSLSSGPDAARHGCAGVSAVKTDGLRRPGDDVSWRSPGGGPQQGWPKFSTPGPTLSPLAARCKRPRRSAACGCRQKRRRRPLDGRGWREAPR